MGGEQERGKEVKRSEVAEKMSTMTNAVYRIRSENWQCWPSPEPFWCSGNKSLIGKEERREGRQRG